jgi:hypothetical protein
MMVQEKSLSDRIDGPAWSGTSSWKNLQEPHRCNIVFISDGKCVEVSRGCHMLVA